jgi:predicted polyphosphate/ATP-dependent NAD kinase
MDGHEAAKQRAANPNLSFLRVVAIKLNERNRLNQHTSASEIAEICLEENVEIPGLGAENQTVEQGPQQIGKIMGGLFKDAAEVVFDEFRVVRQQEQGRSEAGNPLTLNRYTFSLVNPVTSTTSPPSPPSLNPAGPS